MKIKVHSCVLPAVDVIAEWFEQHFGPGFDVSRRQAVTFAIRSLSQLPEKQLGLTRLRCVSGSMSETFTVDVAAELVKKLKGFVQEHRLIVPDILVLASALVLFRAESLDTEVRNWKSNSSLILVR